MGNPINLNAEFRRSLHGDLIGKFGLRWMLDFDMPKDADAAKDFLHALASRGCFEMAELLRMKFGHGSNSIPRRSAMVKAETSRSAPGN